MKKKVITIVIILIVLLIFVSIFMYFSNILKKKNLSTEEKIDNIMNKMTLEEKIAQMLIITYSTNITEDFLLKSLKNNQPGGFIILGSNVSDYDGTKKFIKIIKSNVKVPMFIVTDFEGGQVQRFKDMDEEVIDIPSAKKIGKVNDEEFAYNIGKIIGEQSRSLGINTILGPVVDVGFNEHLTDRVFSENEKNVSSLGKQVKNGIESIGLISVYKHFPGIGSTDSDSHYIIPQINKTYEELLSKDLVPYVDNINNIDIIMVSHASYPNITKDIVPASISKIMIKDILKDKLQYKGLVAVDAVNMGALTNHYKEKEIYEYGINAGVDLFIMPSNSLKVINIIKELIKEGKVDESTIDESVRKILTLKYKKLSNFSSYDKSYFNNKEQKRIIEEGLSRINK